MKRKIFSKDFRDNKMASYIVLIYLVFSTMDPILAISLDRNIDLYNKCFNDENMYLYQQRMFSDLDPECIRYFMEIVASEKSKMGITNEQINYLRSVEREGISILYNKRSKRSYDYRLVRKECRVLTERERCSLFFAMRYLKFGTKNNIYDLFANMHKSYRSFLNAHLGSNFLGWHRVYLYYFERALRRVVPTSLCYWDSTLDYLIPNGRQNETSAFTENMFGNGKGKVITGPFRNWPIPDQNVSLRRDIGSLSRLMRPHIVDMIMNDVTIRNHTQITFGGPGLGFPDPDQPLRRASLEGEHNNGHVWVGEVMMDARLAPQDGVFWFHHSFIDYVWEHFRQKMIRLNLDPETDYPSHGGQPHAGETPMEHLYNISRYWINKNGLTNDFTRYVYRYQDHPTCGNNCQGGHEFLYCPKGGRKTDRCVAKVRKISVADVVTFGGRTAAGFGITADTGNTVSGAGMNIDSIAVNAAKKEGPLILSNQTFQSTV